MRNNADPCRYTQKIISKYLKSFLAERKDVLRSVGIEPVHRMRVASRRLRAALSVFKCAGTWRKEVGRIGRALGLARQLDVQIRFLKAAGDADAEVIIKSLKTKRKQAQGRIRAALDGFEIGEILPGEFDFRDSAIILKRLDEMLAFAPYVPKPQSVKELHRMRIAAKKLRYTLEIFRPWHGTGFNEYIGASRDIQDLLGDLHELDLLLEVLSGFSSPRLMRECIKLRKSAYLKFVRLWMGLRKKQIWVKLRKEV